MWAVILRRKNGRYVKRLDMARSKYAAKQAAKWWREQYDETYHILVEPLTNASHVVSNEGNAR